MKIKDAPALTSNAPKTSTDPIAETKILRYGLFPEPEEDEEDDRIQGKNIEANSLGDVGVGGVHGLRELGNLFEVEVDVAEAGVWFDRVVAKASDAREGGDQRNYRVQYEDSRVGDGKGDQAKISANAETAFRLGKNGSEL